MTETLRTDRFGEVQTLVVYSLPESWKYSFYTNRAFIEGDMSAHMNPAQAVEEAGRIARQIFGDVTFDWDIIDAGWWVAHAVLPAD